jgi:hypothetical protein
VTWSDFIEKIRSFRAAGAKTGLNAPAMIRMLYMGAFDDMLPPETLKIPATERYPALLKEMLGAMASKAKLPKKKVTEVIGMTQLDSTANLMLWRFENNPFVQYDITRYFVTFLKDKGYVKAQGRSDDVLWERQITESSRTQVDIRYSWIHSFHSTVLPQYEKGKLLGVLGVIVKAERKIFQGNRESIGLILFNGHEHTNEIRIWPGEDGKVSEVLKAQLKPGKVGLAVLKPKLWNSRPSASLVSWHPTLGGA